MHELVYWTAASALGVGFCLSALATALMRRFARRRQFVDLPGGHKSHTRPVALGGGVAITAALVLPLAVGFGLLPIIEPLHWLPENVGVHLPGLRSKSGAAFGIIGGAILLHALGIIDDKMHLGPWIKLIVQTLVAGFVAVILQIRVMTVLGDTLSVFATVVWIVLITNAFNFLDNMDGLCAGVAAIAAAIFAMSAAMMNQIFVPTLACLVAGVMCGYLCYNFPPASIFMGDAGSLVVGYFMAVVTILTTYWDPALQHSRIGLIVPIIVLSVPLYDTASVVLIRLRAGHSPFKGDQRHFSHRLLQRGMKPKTALVTIYLATAATGLGAAVLPRASTLMAIFIVVQCALVVLMIAVLEQAKPNAGTDTH